MNGISNKAYNWSPVVFKNMERRIEPEPELFSFYHPEWEMICERNENGIIQYLFASKVVLMMTQKLLNMQRILNPKWFVIIAVVHSVYFFCWYIEETSEMIKKLLT